MIYINNSIKNLLIESSIKREIILKFPEDDSIPDIGNEFIANDSFELKQSVCSAAELTFGGGESGQLTVNLIDCPYDLSGKRVNVWIKQTYLHDFLTPSDSLFPGRNLLPGKLYDVFECQLFSGTVFSCKRQKNRSIKELIAYDDMYNFSKIQVSSNALTGNAAYADNQTLYDFIRLMMEYADRDYTIFHDSTASFNDSEVLDWNLASATSAAQDGKKLSELLTAYAELNAGFAIIDRNGSLRIKSLTQSDDGVITTRKKDVSEVIEYYSDLSFEEFTVKPINYIRFPRLNNNSFAYGSSLNNSCYFSENIIAKMCDDVSRLVTNFHKSGTNRNFIFGDIVTYRPFKADVFDRWWLEPGDRIQINTGFDNGDVQIVDSFVLSRTIKGINAMKVTLEANGVERLGIKEEGASNGI